jgi:hypothetical protein
MPKEKGCGLVNDHQNGLLDIKILIVISFLSGIVMALIQHDFAE